MEKSHRAMVGSGGVGGLGVAIFYSRPAVPYKTGFAKIVGH